MNRTNAVTLANTMFPFYLLVSTCVSWRDYRETRFLASTVRSLEQNTHPFEDRRLTYWPVRSLGVFIAPEVYKPGFSSSCSVWNNPGLVRVHSPRQVYALTAILERLLPPGRGRGEDVTALKTMQRLFFSSFHRSWQGLALHLCHPY